MRKEWVCEYDKGNILMLICDTYILYRLIESWWQPLSAVIYFTNKKPWFISFFCCSNPLSYDDNHRCINCYCLISEHQSLSENDINYICLQNLWWMCFPIYNKTSLFHDILLHNLKIIASNNLHSYFMIIDINFTLSTLTHGHFYPWTFFFYINSLKHYSDVFDDSLQLRIV